MKKLSLYVFLVLMFCNVGFAKDLTGVKLFCNVSFSGSFDDRGIEFLSDTKGKHYSIDKLTDLFNWTLSIKEFSYVVSPTLIHLRGDIYSDYIVRETLKLDGVHQCEILDKDINFKEKMQIYLNDSIKEQESKNKL